MILDIKTLIVCNFATSFFMALSLLYYMINYKTYKGYGFWLAATFVLSITFATILFRPLMPLWISVVLTNSTAVLVSVLRLDGIHRFTRDHKLVIIYYSLPFATIPFSLYFLIVDDNVILRNLVSSFFLAILTFMQSAELYRNRRRENSKLYSATILLMISYGLFIILRALTWFFYSRDSLLVAGVVHQLYFLIITVFEMAIGITWLMMNNQRLETELLEKNQIIIQDLKVAERIQKQMFSEYTVPPYLNIVVKYIPHSHVSGDIYKIYPYENGTYNLFLGDSTGHGVAAALATVMANIILLEERQSTLKQIMEHLNEVFLRNLPDERYMSAILTNVNQQGELKAIIAGHPPLIVIPANGDDPIILGGKSTLLGILPTPIFTVEETRYNLMPGDKAILYTDGIYERDNLEGKMFGLNKLRRFLKENRDHDLDSLLSHLLEHVNSYTQSKVADDDITLVAFEYIPYPLSEYVETSPA
ncbi:MAG: serine/threonine-protein phosphatase [SAR324 cluster bacterium]|nr:serine/threonine-protein phosphatase [SAR324 cluster bacterium]